MCNANVFYFSLFFISINLISVSFPFKLSGDGNFHPINGFSVKSLTCILGLILRTRKKNCGEKCPYLNRAKCSNG